jgi:hypothetical protein
MGLFSWKCALSNVEIANNMIDMPTWMSEIVVLQEDGTVLKGSYDGYGRVRTDVGTVDFYREFMDKNGWDMDSTPTVVLQRAYDGESFDQVDPSPMAEFQGHFFPEEYDHNADEQLNNML